MVFRNGGKLSKRERWKLNGENIEIVKYYKYLGVGLTPQLSLTKHFEEKLGISKTAILINYRHFISNKDVTLIAKFKVFDSVMRAIMCYAAQVWGHQRHQIVEKINTFFLKKLFMLPRNMPHYIIYSETNVKPLFNFTLKMHYNYIKRVMVMPQVRLVKQTAQEIIHKKNILVQRMPTIM